MVRLTRLIILLLVIFAFSMVGVRSQSPLPTIPRVQGSSLTMSLTGCASVVGVCTSAGWNGTTTKPNPTITVQQGDLISISLQSADGAPHLFLVDADKDGAADTADCPTVDPCSTTFTTTTMTYAFIAYFAPGTYTYFCTFHPFAMFASFVVTPNTVGGTIVPVDKLSLALPYIEVSIVLGTIAATLIVYLRRSSQKTL